MKVRLLFEVPLALVASGIRKSHDNEHLSDSNGLEVGKKDLDLIKRVGCKLKHSSVLEFCTLTFDIRGISRGLLQELARHRMASLTVKSTRYTINKELKKDIEWFTVKGNVTHDAIEVAEKLCVVPNDIDEDTKSAMIISNAYSLASVAQALKAGVANDKAKYMLPESYKTDLQYSINLRSFINMYQLRSHKSALPEFRVLVDKMLKSLSEEVQSVVIEAIH